MKSRVFAVAAVVGVGILLGSYRVSTQAPPPEGAAADGSPAWSLRGSFPDPTGRTIVDRDGRVTIPPRVAGAANVATAPAAPILETPPCRRSPLCGNRLGRSRQTLQRVFWQPTLGYTFTYPYALPPGFGGVPAVALDSRNNLWVFQRADAGKPQLFKFDASANLILTVGPEVIGYQDKAHGMAVDADDNVWITAANGATVMKIGRDGKLLMTIGQRGRRGDWNEAAGQRLLWQPVMVAFGPSGDVYIGEGHANESPNDTESDDAANNLGAARIIHLDKTGRFIKQWYGNEVGPGKFSSAHGLAVDPSNGDVWIGDREEYRIVVYSSDGRFLRTIQMRNLVCAINFDRHGNPWIATGQDGQFLKIDRAGKVLGAVGNGMGIEPGQFIEASYWSFDAQDNLYAGDTSVGRVTKMVAPAARSPGGDIVDGRQWFEPGAERSARDGLRRAAIAAAFNEPDAEALLRAVIRANPSSDDASHAYHLLSRIYIRSAQYARLVDNFERWSAAFPSRPEVLAERRDVDPFRGLPDQRSGPVRAATLRHDSGDDWSIKAAVNGKPVEYLFDTGAGVSLVSSAEAKRLGLKIRAGSAVMGEPSGKGVRFRTAVASDVRLGGMRFRDVSFAVVESDDVVGILGMPIWLAVRHVTWTNGGSWTLGTPSAPVDRSARNVVFSGDKALLAMELSGTRVFGSLDTGAFDTDLNENFAIRFPDIARTGTKGTHEITGAGGTTSFPSIAVPEVALQIGPTRAVLRPVHVTMQQIIGGPCCIGNIGRDALAQTGRFDLDLSTMTLRLQ